MSAAEELDEALSRFQQGGLEYGGGLANHGPMAAEALVRLGHASLIPGFVQLYAPRLGAREGEGRPLPDDAARREALGRPESLSAWVATFERAAAGAAWRELAGREIPPLLPGLFASAGHGWLRVAHAVRALDERDSPPRRRAPAQGHALWAARFQGLPGRPGSRVLGGDRPPGEVLADVSPVPAADRRTGAFFQAVRVLDEPRYAEPFGRSLSAAALPDGLADAGAWIGDLVRAAARLYLRNPGARIAYVHTLTVPSALRLMLPVLDDTGVREAAAGCLRAAAALHAVSAGDAAAEQTDPELARLAGAPAEIRYRAACSLQEHAIKMAEACLREDREEPDPALRRAAADAAARLEGARSPRC